MEWLTDLQIIAGVLLSVFGFEWTSGIHVPAWAVALTCFFAVLAYWIVYGLTQDLRAIYADLAELRTGLQEYHSRLGALEEKFARLSETYAERQSRGIFSRGAGPEDDF
jgi:hypothetical protein